ncbi:MAG: response regulator [Acidobacteriia bacterium]|nr:response regulator [Terriglobia bacterium]
MKPTVMLVDDDANVLAGLCRALHKEPYDIVKAGSAAEALEILRARPVDVVVSDEEMPAMSGTVFLRQVREKYPDTIRFILTGRATLDNAIAAINDGGVTRFFIKPCDHLDLAASIRQGLQQRELMLAARRLLHKVKRQSAMIKQLERAYPNITKVKRDGDGAILLEDWNGDINQLMRDICSHLDHD